VRGLLAPPHTSCPQTPHLRPTPPTHTRTQSAPADGTRTQNSRNPLQLQSAEKNSHPNTNSNPASLANISLHERCKYHQLIHTTQIQASLHPLRFPSRLRGFAASRETIRLVLNRPLTTNPPLAPVKRGRGVGGEGVTCTTPHLLPANTPPPAHATYSYSYSVRPGGRYSFAKQPKPAAAAIRRKEFTSKHEQQPRLISEH